jgi:hypothetical protein
MNANCQQAIGMESLCVIEKRASAIHARGVLEQMKGNAWGGIKGQSFLYIERCSCAL